MTQDIVPQKDVTVEFPVIIVRSTSVMAFTIFQNITNLHNADSTFCFCNVILTFLWSVVREHVS